MKTVSFQPTPLMPTYVFGFWVADFHCLTTRALATGVDGAAGPLLCCESLAPALPPLPATSRPLSPVPPPPFSPLLPLPPEEEIRCDEETVEVSVQVLSSVSLEGAEFALDLARRAFELFSRLFSVRFPLAKLDLLGMPRMHGLGMENFGAITLLQVGVVARFPSCVCVRFVCAVVVLEYLYVCARVHEWSARAILQYVFFVPDTAIAMVVAVVLVLVVKGERVPVYSVPAAAQAS